MPSCRRDRRRIAHRLYEAFKRAEAEVLTGAIFERTRNAMWEHMLDDVWYLHRPIHRTNLAAVEVFEGMYEDLVASTLIERKRGR